MRLRRGRALWLIGGLGTAAALIFVLDSLGYLFVALPGLATPPPIPPPVFTDGCDPGDDAARLALADAATRVALPWAVVTRATVSDSHSSFIEPSSCSGTQIEIDYVSTNLHATFVQLCSRVGRLGWSPNGAPRAHSPVFEGDAIQETCDFTKELGGHEATLEVDRFSSTGYILPSVVLFLNGPELRAQR